MGLNFLISERRSRRSRLRWARSAASVCVRCSRIWRGAQRCLVARARKSSTSLATACKPICSSCAGRLLLGVVVARVGEFIVSLQIVGTDIQRLSVGMPAEVHCRQWRGAMLPAQQEGDRGGPRRIPFQSFPDGAAQSGHAVQIQQTEKLCALAGGRFSFGESSLQQGFAFRNGQREAARARLVEGLAFGAQQGLFVRRIQNLLLPVIGAMMPGDLGGAVEDAYVRIRSHQGERPTYRLGRDGIVVEIEMHVDGLAGAYRLHPIGGEGMERK